jgi:hypothetical protein
VSGAPGVPWPTPAEGPIFRDVLPAEYSAFARAHGVVAAGVVAATDKATPQRILLDTDMDTDDLLALMYLLKQNRSEFELKVFSSTRSSLLLHVRSWLG